MTNAQRVVMSLLKGIAICLGVIVFGMFIFRAYQLAFVPESEYIEYVKRCGRVVDKKQPAVMDVHKHSADLEVHEYLYVEYQSGVEKEDVNAKTWYRYQIGDPICFTERAEGANFESAKVLVGGLIGWILIILFVAISGVVFWHMLGGAGLGEAIYKMWNE